MISGYEKTLRAAVELWLDTGEVSNVGIVDDEWVINCDNPIFEITGYGVYYGDLNLASGGIQAFKTYLDSIIDRWGI